MKPKLDRLLRVDVTEALGTLVQDAALRNACSMAAFARRALINELERQGVSYSPMNANGERPPQAA